MHNNYKVEKTSKGWKLRNIKNNKLLKTVYSTKKDAENGIKLICKRCRNLKNGRKRKMKGDGFVDTAKAFFFGRKDLPPAVRNVLKIHGDSEISYIQVARNPVSKTTQGLMNLFSGGKFKKEVEKLPYDDIFHLYMIITLKNGKNISTEKDEVIKMKVGQSVRANAESRIIKNIPSGLTLQKLITKTKGYMGKKFLPYDARDNNCQVYLNSILKANNLGNNEIYNWVKQDTASIFKALPELGKTSRLITDIASRFNVLKEGAGYKK